MLDFIFGDMVSEEERIEKYRKVVRSVSHLSRRRPLQARPGEEVRLALSIGPAVVTQEAFVYYTTDGLDPIGSKGKAAQGFALAMQKNTVEWNMPEWGYVQVYTTTIPAQRSGTVVRYRLSSLTPAGEEIFADDGKYYAFSVDEYQTPQWAKEAILYHIIVDRFSPGFGKSWNSTQDVEDIYGGTLRGIIEHLDHIQELGANTLYLSPLFPCNSHHGYDSTDYFEIEPRFGSKEDFKELLDALHQRGMKFIMDFVPNHWSNRHATFQDAITNPNSPYRDWYVFRNYPDDYECFFKVKEMPKINLRNADARRHILNAACYWLKFGVDGFRIDYAIGPSPDFWADFRSAAKRTKADCWIFGEVVDPPDSQKALVGLLDGCLDFHLLEFIRKCFGSREWDFERFSAFLEKHFSFFPDDFLLPSMLDNHDMDRFSWIAGKDVRLLKLAALTQCFLPNPPVLYYGTEVGLSQNTGIRSEYGGFGHLGEARLPMIWDEDQDRDLYQFFKTLYQLRKDLAFHNRREIFFEKVAPTSLLLSFKNSSPIRLVLNIGEKDEQFEIEYRTAPIAFCTAYCQMSKDHDKYRLTLPAFSGAILY